MIETRDYYCHVGDVILSTLVSFVCPTVQWQTPASTPFFMAQSNEDQRRPPLLVVVTGEESLIKVSIPSGSLFEWLQERANRQCTASGCTRASEVLSDRQFYNNKQEEERKRILLVTQL